MAQIYKKNVTFQMFFLLFFTIFNSESGKIVAVAFFLVENPCPSSAQTDSNSSARPLPQHRRRKLFRSSYLLINATHIYKLPSQVAVNYFSH